MKIGFFTDAYFPQPNGVSTSIRDSAKALEELGHEVVIVAPKYPGYKDSKNVIRLTSLKVYKQPEMRMALHLPEPSIRKILKIDFDVIHGHSGGPVTLLGWEIARSKNIPYIMTYHTLWSKYTHYFLKGKVIKPRMLERVSRIFGNRCDIIISPTERVKNELVKYGIKKDIRVLPTGVELKKFKNTKKGFLHSKLDIKKENKILLYVGRLGREKSVDFLIKAFKMVLAKDKNTVLVLVGDGPERKSLTRLAAELKVDEKVYFLGFMDPEFIPSVYADSDLFVFASKTETQGLVVPEALASGLPVVAVRDEALEYVVESGKNGFLVDSDEKIFSDKVVEVLKSSKLKSLSMNAKASVQKYSVQKMAIALEDLYHEQLLKKSKESISKIMGSNLIQEQFFIIHMFFWLSILFMRTSIFFTYEKASLYPQLIFKGFHVYHLYIGVFLVFSAGLLYFVRKKVSLVTLMLLGIGIGWACDELWVFLSGGPLGHSDYWARGNLFFVLFLGILPVLLVKIGRKNKFQFVFGEKNQKHINPENPLISVVIPAYNEGKFIENTLRSILNQTIKEFELIVVDNNSSDKTGDVARSFGARVIVEKKKGVAWARQTGFMHAKGRIIATTDADTVVPENWLETIIKEHEKKGVVAFGGLNRLYSGPVTARAATRYLSTVYWWVDKVLSGGWNMLGSNMSVSKEAFLNINGFRTDLKLGEDVDLSQRIKTQGKVVLSSDFLVFSSGRRFRTGFLMGVLTYAPSWTMRVFFKKDKFLTFPTIRNENSLFGKLTLIPLSVGIILLALLFYSFNSR